MVLRGNFQRRGYIEESTKNDAIPYINIVYYISIPGSVPYIPCTVRVQYSIIVCCILETTNYITGYRISIIYYTHEYVLYILYILYVKRAEYTVYTVCTEMQKGGFRFRILS